ncbi:MAG: glycosyltransferase family protein [Candidatus Kapabacteria bacterium]|nr:glycosyltransferase family protein [Ignavibacteriota bacterium]MCW5884747.1 glycosyltransferase family protein [Candidatus Kapabacteria bacterium]
MIILAVMQARCGSTRFPLKVLKEISNRTLLEIEARRILKSKYLTDFVIATTTNPNDDLIENLSAELSLKCFRGDENDLLDRHYQVAKLMHADAVIKIPSDCPLIDPEIIDKVVGFYMNNHPNYDYVSNLHPPTHPDGNDVEIMSFQALERMWIEAKSPHQREHTTPYILENSNIFRIANIEWENGLDYSKEIRLTVDYPEDFDFIKAIYEELSIQNEYFNLNDILELLNRKPELKEFNKIHNGKFWYNSIYSQTK